jgi:predicted GTPase
VNVLGDLVWQELQDHIRRTARRRAAIAFVGRTVTHVLRCGHADVIVVDGSDNALAAGATNLDTQAAWLAAGVRV